MASRQPYQTSFDVDNVLQPIFTGDSVAMDARGRVLATALETGDVMLTDPSNGRHLARIEGDGEPVAALAMTPSGGHLALCSRSLMMQTYALRFVEAHVEELEMDLDDAANDDTNDDQNDTTNTQVKTAKTTKTTHASVEATLLRTTKAHTTLVHSTAVDATGTLLAIGCTDGTIKLWDISKGFVTHTFRGPAGLVTALHFYSTVTDRTKDGKSNDKKPSHKKSSDKKPPVDDNDDDDEDRHVRVSYRLVSGSQDGQIRVWDLSRRKAIANLDSHVSDVTGLDYAPESNTIVSCSRDKTLIWWDAQSWKTRRIVPCLETVETVGFLDQGRLTYCGGSRAQLRIWDTDAGGEITQEQADRPATEGIMGALYHPGSPFVLVQQADHTLALYRPVTRTDKELRETRILEPFRRIAGTHDEIIDLAYLLPDQSQLALATNSEDIHIVSAASAPPSSSLSPSSSSDWTSSSSPADHTYFGQEVARLRGHEDIIVTLDVDWSGHWIATGAKDNTARVWRIDAANDAYECWAVFSGHAESLGAVALPKATPPPESAAYREPLHHPPAYLVTGSQDQTIKKWKIPRTAVPLSTRPRAEFTRKAHDKDINAMAISPRGHVFASASQDKLVKIWSVDDGEVQGILRGHRRGVWSVQFAPLAMPALQGEEGTPVSGSKGLVLTGGGDKTLKLWNLYDYSCIRTFEGHSHSVLKVAWLHPPTNDNSSGGGNSSNSKKPVLVGSAGGDGLVKIWNANSGEAECTLDNHEDRVWALAVHPKTNTVVSGGGDATVTFWRDTSTETQVAASEAAARLLEQEQTLENHIHAGSYREAITLALQLNHPGRLLSLFTKVATSDAQDPGSRSGLLAVDQVLASLSDEQLYLLFLRLRDWNANARTAPVAQRILNALLHSYPAEKFVSLSGQGRKNIQQILHALLAYTERHYRRAEELLDESYLVEYTLNEMTDSAFPELEIADVAMTDRA